MAIILGIDPGSRVTGYGIIRQTGRQLSYLGSGCIRTVVDDMPTRLKLIYAGVSEIITQFHPDFFAIESVFMAKNPDSALKLGQARGAAIVAAVNQQNAGISQIFSAIADLSQIMDATLKRLESTQQATGTLEAVSTEVSEMAQQFTVN